MSGGLPKLERMALGEPGAAWVRRQLVTGGSLSRALLEHTSALQGSVSTFLPSGATGPLLTDFEHDVFARIAPGQSDAVGTACADEAIESARRLGAPLFVAEPYLRRDGFEPNMRWGEDLELRPERAAFHGESVLLWHPVDEISVDEMGWLIGDDVAVLSDLPRTFAPLAELTDDELDEIAARARGILVGAYGMSLLLWVRT